MNPYQTNVFINAQAHPPPDYGPTQKALLNRDAFADVEAEVTRLPGYQPTPLIALNGLAAASGVEGLWCKHEGSRFEVGSFKPTGPVYAMLSVLKGEIKKATGVETVTTQDLINRKYESVTREVVVSAATSGNHGRALAWGARMFGCRCVIYMNDGVSAGREEAIAAYGAEVVRVPGSYDRAVQRSYADAEMFGYFAISDEKSAEYPHISREIMQGYAMVADEIVRQFSDGQPPTHVFVPGGGGRLAAATCGHLWERYESNHPRIIVVEPTASACLYRSAIENSAATVSEDGRSVMDGLVVESASPQAWDILKAGAFAFLTIPDEAAVDAMRQAATGVGGDPPIVIGETGIAAWAGFLATTRDENLRQQLGLDSNSRIVIIATEGVTDPEVYRNLVGTTPEAVLAATKPQKDSAMTGREYLESIMPTREMVDHFVTPAKADVPVELARIMCNNAQSAFDPEIGWVVCDGFRGGGVDDSRGFYAYEKDGARRVVNYADRPCRIHTYGNSFTHCDQVSNGETWQEYLAAHLLEPVRNYGIGGHSVYQAYRRMLIVEREYPAEYVILNVWDDDHFRNLDAWRSIRMGRQGRFTLPHLCVNLESGTVEERENLCKTPEELYRLCDADWVWETFGDDPILHAVMARKGSVEDASAMAQSMGGELENAGSDAEVYSLHTEAALFATRFVIEKAEAFTKANGKKLLVILSFGSHNVANALKGEPLFDQTFLDWLATKDVPIIDLRDAFREEYTTYRGDVQTFLAPYYIGHHTPRGNFFFAWAIKDRIVEWLDPKPLPYQIASD